MSAQAHSLEAVMIASKLLAHHIRKMNRLLGNNSESSDDSRDN